MIEFFARSGPKLTLDEASALDIGSCIVDGIDLAPGQAIPDDGDPRIAHSLQGFLFTCGPDHIRHREKSGTVNYPLHGSLAGHGAHVLWTKSENGDAECRGDIALVTADGSPMVLERLWRIDGKSGEVSLWDKVVNTGTKEAPVFLMYHINIGGKWLNDNAHLSGSMLDQGGFPWRFGDDGGGTFCVPVHKQQNWAQIDLGPIAAIGDKTLRIQFDATTLPYLQVWRNQKAPTDVLGIEPVSHRWVARAELEKNRELVWLNPGESRHYALRFSFI